MTTAQPFTTQNLQSAPVEDQMEMAASPYAQYDDIDFELDEEFEQFASTDKMTDENASQGVKDDPMKDSSVNNDNTIENEIDLDMEPAENIGDNEHNLEHISTEEELPLNPSSIPEFELTTNTDAAGDNDLLDRDIALEDEDFLFEEEEEHTDHDTNNIHPEPTITTTTDSGQHKDTTTTQSENDSKHPISAEEVKDTVDIVDFAVEESTTSNTAASKSETVSSKTTTSGNDNDNVSAVARPIHQSETSVTDNGLFDKSLPADQQPEIVPDESESEEHDSPFNQSAATHLHPITLHYEDQDMSLFPPLEEDDSATYFLGDASLAFESIDKLLSACRDLLGESIGHDDEMVIDIPSLGLHICEDSKYATNLTLAQIIDTYMLLSQNENLSPIKPLYCELTHRVCLTTQMAYLVSSAREGKKYTDIVSEHMDTPDLGDESAEFDESVDYEGDATEESSGQKVTNAAQDFDSIPNDDHLKGQQEQPKGLSLNDQAESASSKSPNMNGSDGRQIESVPSPKPASEKLGPVVDHEDDARSQSSHTLEGDQDEDAEQLDFDEFDPEETDLLETDEIDLGLDADELNVESTAEPDIPKVMEHVDEAHTSDAQAADLAEQSVEHVDTLAVNAPIPSDKLLATPSKGSNIKRKFVDDEDDFLEIDISTPEPKRRRPS